MAKAILETKEIVPAVPAVTEQCVVLTLTKDEAALIENIFGFSYGYSLTAESIHKAIFNVIGSRSPSNTVTSIRDNKLYINDKPGM